MSRQACAGPIRSPAASSPRGVQPRYVKNGWLAVARTVLPEASRSRCTGFVPVRKPGKLPYRTVRREYDLEYGSDALEMHEDAVEEGDRVLVVDDLLATGGTAFACSELVSGRGAEVLGFGFVVELAFLNGRARLDGHDIASLITY